MLKEYEPQHIEEGVKTENSLRNKVILVTGASRGIGAEIALLAGLEGAIVIGPHRDPGKEKRATSIAKTVKDSGGRMIAPIADITKPQDRDHLVAYIKGTFGKVDMIIHNAAGGLEEWATPDYARLINSESKSDLTEALYDILPTDAKVIDIPSLWSYYSGTGIEALPEYDLVATTKKEGEEKLKETLARLNLASGKNVRLGFACGNAIDGTATMMYFRRNYKEKVERFEKNTLNGKLPTAKEMAEGIISFAKSDYSHNQTEFVGIPTLSKDDIKEKLSMYGDNALFVDRLVKIGENHAVGYSKIDERYSRPIFGSLEDLSLLSYGIFNNLQTNIKQEYTDGHFKEETGISIWPGYQQISLLSIAVNGELNSIAELKDVKFKVPIIPEDSIDADTLIINAVGNKVEKSGEIYIKGEMVSSVEKITVDEKIESDINSDFQARTIEAAAQTLGLVFVNQIKDHNLLPLFRGIDSVQFHNPLEPNNKDKNLEIEAKITNIDSKGFQGDTIVRLDNKVIAEIYGIDCGIMHNKIAKRAIQMIRSKTFNE